MIALIAAVALGAPCERPATAEAVSSALDAAEASFGAMDADGFVARTDALEGLLPCLEVPLESATVARLHRVRGIRAFVDRDADLSVRAFAAARRLEPEYRFAEALVPDGHPLRTDYLAIDPATITTVTAPRPKEGRVTFDGLDTLERPVEVPTLLQRLDRSGAVVTSAYLAPDDPLPSWPARRTVHPIERPLRAGIGASAIATVGMFVGAGLSHAAYQRVDGTTADGQDRLDPLRARTNGLLVGSAIGAGLTAGAGAGLALLVFR